MIPNCGPLVNDCVLSLPTRCIIYDGPNTSNIGYIQNMRLTDLLLLIDSKMGGVASGTYMSSSTSVAITGSGISSSPYVPSAIISPQAGNGLSILSDGLYATSPPSVNIYNSDGILTGNRIIDGSSNSLTFNDISQFTLNANFYSWQNSNTGAGIAYDGFSLALNGGGPTGGVSITSGAGTTIDIGAVPVSNVAIILPGFPNPGGQFLTTDALGKLTLATISIPSTPDLQSVTDVGNETTNVIVVKGSNNFVGHGDGLYLTHVPSSGSSIVSLDPDTPFQYGSLVFSTSGVSLSCQANAGIGRLLSIISSGTGGAMDISAEVISISFGDLTFASAGNSPSFNTTVIGQPATLPNEFVTLSQIITPTLQQVTTAGNTTTDNMTIAPAVNTSGSMTITGTGTAGGTFLATSQFGNSAVLRTFPTLSEMRVVNGTSSSITVDGATSVINILNSASIVFSSGGSSTIQYSGGGLIFNNNLAAETNRITADGRMTGTAASTSNQFVTLSQLTATAVLIVGTSLASTAIDQAYMNTNHASVPIGNSVWFTNLSDDATKVLIVNKTGATTWSANADTKLT